MPQTSHVVQKRHFEKNKIQNTNNTNKYQHMQIPENTETYDLKLDIQNTINSNTYTRNTKTN